MGSSGTPWGVVMSVLFLFFVFIEVYTVMRIGFIGRRSPKEGPLA